MTVGVVFLGCSQQPAGPQLDPAGFPRSIHALEKTADDILAAYERGATTTADRALQTIDRQVRSVRRMADVAPIDDGARQSIGAAIDQLAAGLTELNALQGSQTDGSDAAPIAAEEVTEKVTALRGLVSGLRENLPAPILEELDQLDAADAEREVKRAANRAKAAAESEAAEATDAAATDAAASDAEPNELTPGVDTPAPNASAADGSLLEDEELAVDAGPAETP